MSIQEDRDELNNTGIRGLLHEAMRDSAEGFIRELPGGWLGEQVRSRPEPGSGPYLHFRRGFPVLRYRNETADDKSCTEFRAFI